MWSNFPSCKRVVGPIYDTPIVQQRLQNVRSFMLCKGIY